MTMLATVGGAAGCTWIFDIVLWHSIRNSYAYSSITEIKLLDNNQLDISIHKQANITIPLSNFKFNVKGDDELFGQNLSGYIVKAGDAYYHVNGNVRFNRTLLEKIIQW